MWWVDHRCAPCWVRDNQRWMARFLPAGIQPRWSSPGGLILHKQALVELSRTVVLLPRCGSQCSRFHRNRLRHWLSWCIEDRLDAQVAR